MLSDWITFQHPPSLVLTDVCSISIHDTVARAYPRASRIAKRVYLIIYRFIVGTKLYSYWMILRVQKKRNDRSGDERGTERRKFIVQRSRPCCKPKTNNRWSNFCSVVRVVFGCCILRTPGSAARSTQRRRTTVSPVGTPANSWKLTAIASRPSVKLINAFILAPSNEVLRWENGATRAKNAKESFLEDPGCLSV